MQGGPISIVLRLITDFRTHGFATMSLLSSTMKVTPGVSIAVLFAGGSPDDAFVVLFPVTDAFLPGSNFCAVSFSVFDDKMELFPDGVFFELFS